MSLGTGIDSRRRRRSDDPPAPARPVAPAFIAAPRLTGAGRIGGEVTLDPGRWSGVPAPTLSLQWQRNRADIPGAVAPSFALLPEADRAELRCRVTARNVLGEAVVYSEEITIAYEAPAAKGSLADAVYIRNSGDQILNAFPEFTGGALTFSVTGEGVAIDPVTGLLTIRTDALANGIAVVVTATNSGGTATSSFRVTVAAAPEVTEPVMTEAPALRGPALIGGEVTLDPGVWSGKPAPDLSFQWRRDGADIPGATQAAYTPGAADDRTALSCAVTASNAGGSLVAVTAPRGVTYAAPTAGAGVPDQTLTQGTGVKTIDAGAIFTGSGLSWSIPSGPTGVTIDKGLISIATDTLRAGVSVTLRASNSGGSIDDTFRLTVGTAPALSGTPIPDQLNLIRGSAATTVSVAPAFSETVTAYSITGAGVSINSSTGLITISKTTTQAQQTVTVRAANDYGYAEASFQMSVIMQVLLNADITLSWRKDPTGESASGVPADFFTWTVDLANPPAGMTALWWRPDAHVAGAGPGTGYHPMIPHPSIANRWVARAVTPTTGAPRLQGFLYVSDPTAGSANYIVGRSKTHHFIYSTTALPANPLTAMEFSGPSAALVATVVLTGSAAITNAPTLSPTHGKVGSAITMAYSPVTGDPTPTNSRRLLLNSTAISTAASYTPVTADIGKTLIVEQSATNTGGTAVRKSAGITIISGSSVTTVSTVAQLQTAMINAAGGAIIEVTGGEKTGTITRSTATTKSPPITVRAQDPLDPPIFTERLLTLSNWNGLILDGLHFVNTVPDTRTAISPFALYFPDSCSNIKVLNCYFDGWFGTVYTQTANNETAQHTNFEVAYNTVVNSRCDVFRMYHRHVNLWVHHNKISQMAASLAWQGDIDRHPDGHQLACTSGRRACDGVIFEDNHIHSTQLTVDLHGIFCQSERVTKEGNNIDLYSHNDVTVRRNYIYTSHCQGIGLGGVINSTIRDNKLVRTVGSPTTDIRTPQIYFLGAAGTLHCKNIDIINNAWNLIGGQSTLKYGTGGGTNINKVGNLNVAIADPVGWSGFDVAKGIYGQYGNG